MLGFSSLETSCSLWKTEWNSYGCFKDNHGKGKKTAFSGLKESDLTIFTSIMSSKQCPHCNSKNAVEDSLPYTSHPQTTPQIWRSLCHMWHLRSLDRKGIEEDLACTTEWQPTLSKAPGHHSLSNFEQFGGCNCCPFIVTGPILTSDAALETSAIVLPSLI